MSIICLSFCLLSITLLVVSGCNYHRWPAMVEFFLSGSLPLIDFVICDVMSDMANKLLSLSLSLSLPLGMHARVQALSTPALRSRCSHVHCKTVWRLLWRLFQLSGFGDLCLSATDIIVTRKIIRTERMVKVICVTRY